MFTPMLVGLTMNTLFSILTIICSLPSTCTLVLTIPVTKSLDWQIIFKAVQQRIRYSRLYPGYGPAETDPEETGVLFARSDDSEGKLLWFIRP